MSKTYRNCNEPRTISDRAIRRALAQQDAQQFMLQALQEAAAAKVRTVIEEA